MLDRLELGSQLIVPALILMILITRVVKKESLRLKSLKGFVSLPLILFAVLAAWTFNHSQQMRFYLWDEFSGWGPFVKSMFLFDALGPYSPAKVGFPEYLSGISILPYLTVKVGGIWDEGDIYWSYQVLILAILVSSLGLLQWKKHALNLLVISSSILTVTFYFNSFGSIYVDPLLGLLFGLGIVVGTSNEIGKNRWSLFNFAVIVCFISTAKEIGFFFSCTLIFVMVIVNLVGVTSVNSNRYREVFHTFFLGLVTVIPVLIVKFAWEIVLSNQMISSNRSILSVLDGLLFNRPTGEMIHKDELTTNFIEKTFSQPLTTLSGYPLTVVSWVAILTLLWLFLVRSLVTRVEKSKEATTYITVMVGVIGYLGALWLSYLVVFSSGEGVGTASFERYVFTYFLGVLFYLNYRFVHLIYSNSTVVGVSIFSSSWIVFLMLQSSPAHFLSYVSSPNAASANFMSQFVDQRKLIEDMKLTVEDDVWVISQHTTGFEYYFLKYEILPASVGAVPWSIGSAYDLETDIWTDTTVTKETWRNSLDSFDYVYINKVTESFLEEFGSLFENPESTRDPGFYKVEKNEGGNVLVRIVN